MAFLWQRRDDALNIVNEAHIEHPVGFIEHEDFKSVELDAALTHQIKQTAWGCYDDVWAGSECTALRFDTDAAVD